MGMDDQIGHPSYMEGGNISGRFMIFGSVRFFRYENQGEGTEERLDVVWMKVCNNTDWDFYLREMKR